MRIPSLARLGRSVISSSSLPARGSDLTPSPPAVSSCAPGGEGAVSGTASSLESDCGDVGANEYMLVVGFDNREAYRANANDPRMNERYLQYRELLEADPEWHDGEIVYSSTK